MDKKDKYEKIVKLLADNKPSLHNREELTGQIMDQIGQTQPAGPQLRSLHDYAFRWVNNGWFRSAMAAAATIFVAIFVFQQAMINHRISSLEDQLVKTVKSIDSRQDPGMRHLMMLETLVNTQSEGDSIMVSRADLEKLLKAYMKAENIDEELIGNPEYRSYVEELIRKRSGVKTEKRKTLQNL